MATMIPLPEAAAAEGETTSKSNNVNDDKSHNQVAVPINDQDRGSISDDNTTCSLSNQELDQLPDWFWKQPPSFASQLTVLDLSRNYLLELPPALAELKQLQVLNVNRNRLWILPASVLGQLHNLVELHALGNSLRPYKRSLPLDELAQMPHLKLLDIRFHSKLKQAALEALQSVLSPKVEIKISLPGKPDDNDDEGNLASSTSTTIKEHACDRDATLLRSQLEPISTPSLKRRLETTFGIALPDSDPQSFERENVMQQLLQAYQQQCPIREQLRYTGCTVVSALLEPLLTELEQWVWEQDQKGTPRERPKIRASHYMILRTPAEFSTQHSAKQHAAACKLQKHQRLWDLAQQALTDTIQDQDPDFTFSALAVTHNFVGSPHMDTQNIGPFYGIALGNFTQGGELCVEQSATQVAMVDTKNKFAKVDGRFVHWVAPYSPQEDRFSLIYYQTVGHVTPQTTAVLSPSQPAF